MLTLKPTHPPTLNNVELGSCHILQNFHKIVILPRDYRDNVVSKKRAGYKQGTNTWRPFDEGQTVMLRRPKGWKFGSKLVGPYGIIKLSGVNYKIISRGGVEKVVHHDQLKLS